MPRPGRALLMAAFALIAATGPARADDPEEDAPSTAPTVYWRTIETEHFRIHFYEAERHLAERATFLAERAHASLTKYLDWLPRGRIDITITDATDSSNGFASSLPSNYIYAYGVPPEPLFSLNDFDDWLNVLISHELTHVVHLDTILGLPRFVDTLFGKLLAPNLVQPNWFIEGLAVLNESRVSTSGRVRSSIYDMYLRAATLENRFHGIDAVSNGPVTFPQGEAAYLYGSHFLKYLEDRFGPEKLRELSHRYARRLIPFGLNRVAREVYGRRYDELWEDWAEALKRRYAVQVDEVRRQGLTPITRLTFEGEGAVGGVPSPGLAPRFFTDGRGLVYLRSTDFERPAYVQLDPLTGKRRELIEAHAAGVSSPTPDGRGLVYTQVAPLPLPRRVGGNDSAGWEDLFHVDLETHEIRRLTKGRRTHQPDVSPDGKRIVCTIGTHTGSHELAIVPIEGRGAAGQQAQRDRLFTVVVTRRTAGRVFPVQARRISRHPHLRPGHQGRSRADGRSRAGHRTPLLARRPVRAVVLRSHRHLQHLRVRADDGAHVPGDQRAGGRLSAVGVPRPAHAGLHRFFSGRLRRLHGPLRAGDLAPRRAVRQRARRRDDPDAAAGRGPVA